MKTKIQKSQWVGNLGFSEPCLQATKVRNSYKLYS